MAGSIELAKGTKEYIVVPITDVLGNLSTLSGSNPKFDVKTNDADETMVITAEDAEVFGGMSLLCLIDTTAMAFVEQGYKLYVFFAAIPQAPRLGPIYFTVKD